jgi:DNA-binding NarL/FixJ family response regulator
MTVGLIDQAVARRLGLGLRTVQKRVSRLMEEVTCARFQTARQRRDAVRGKPCRSSLATASRRGA